MRGGGCGLCARCEGLVFFLFFLEELLRELCARPAVGTFPGRRCDGPGGPVADSPPPPAVPGEAPRSAMRSVPGGAERRAGERQKFPVTPRSLPVGALAAVSPVTVTRHIPRVLSGQMGESCSPGAKVVAVSL